MQEKVFIEYRASGALANASSVTLASEDGTYGIKTLDGTIVVDNGTSVDNPATGVYEKSIPVNPNTIYFVSWRVVPSSGDLPKYIVQEEQFTNPSDRIRAVADFRGIVAQGTTASLFLKITDIDGNPQDATPITLTITDPDGNLVSTANVEAGPIYTSTPEKIDVGFYAFDWGINLQQAIGKYTIEWSYSVNGVPRTTLQEMVVSSTNTPTNTTTKYAARLNEFRISLEHMIHCAQHVPRYREPARQSSDNKTFRFTFDKWNQSAGVRIYVNDRIVTERITINYFKGEVEFDYPLTDFDRVDADYNFRLLDDEQIDRFLSNAVHLLNIWPAVTSYNLFTLADRYIPIILYGAAVDAIRHLMLCLQFQEPQLVFGGREAAQKVFANLESLKKNYEETWNKALEQKKNTSYKGLTRMMVTPEFALPGGRSRWFRSLFSNGSGG